MMAEQNSSAALGRLSSPVFVGRDAELSKLLQAVTNPPAVALIGGEAGVGKTRLVQELLTREETLDQHRYVGVSQQLIEPFPLGPVLDALRRADPPRSALTPLTGALSSLLPELADLLPAAPAPLADRRAERHRQFRALEELLGALGPTILVLEDLHWADRTTLEFLAFVASRMPPRLTLVCTYRSEDLPEGSPVPGLVSRSAEGCMGIELTAAALDRNEVKELTCSILELEDVSDEFASFVFEGSGGLPFAVEELLRLLAERKDLIRRRGHWVRRSLENIGVPRPVKDSVIERVVRLTPNGRAIVEAAAVLGVPAGEELLIQVAGLTEHDGNAALAEAVRASLLFDVGQAAYGFRHALACQAVVQGISSPLRRRLHLLSAQQLEKGAAPPAARLAHHYRGAGRVNDFVRCAELAADEAISLEDEITAFEFLKEAVNVGRSSPVTQARLAVKMAEQARYCAAHIEAIPVLREVLDGGSLGLEDEGEVRLWLARLLLQAGQLEAATTEAARALGALANRPARAAEAKLTLAYLTVPRADGRPANKQLLLLEGAVDLAVASGERAVQIAALGQRASFLLYLADPRGWEAIECIPEPGDDLAEMRYSALASGNLADALLHLGHLNRADQANKKALALLARGAHSHQAYQFQTTDLQLRWLMGAWDGLEDDARALAEAYAAWGESDVKAVLGLLLLARGSVSESAALLEDLVDSFSGEAAVLGWASGGLARIRLAQHRPEEAWHVASPVLAAIEQKSAWVWATHVAPWAAQALLELDRHRQAEELVEQFGEGIEGRDAPAAVAALAACRGFLAAASEHHAEAAELHLAAERTWASLPCPYAAARSRAEAGRCLGEIDPARGQQLLVGAMDVFRDLGAAWDVATVRQKLRRRGALPPHRVGRKGYGADLSPREQEVARLAGSGRTNREIALELVLAPKTVEHHLASILRKLELVSRTEIPRALATRAESAESKR